jgi:hypothetical protein
MTDKIAAALAAPFDAKDLKQRPGRAGLVFTYADARAVAQRLDDVLGLAGWQFEVKVADPARSVVHGSLAIVVDGKTSIRQDFGYPNSAQDDEPLKSAASDALRRCAAQIGVGRSLYSPEKGQGGIPAPERAATPLRSPQIAPVGASGVPTDDERLARAAMAFAQELGEGTCSHGEAWSLKPGGVSKATGKPYQAFWAASHKIGGAQGAWCKEKPAQGWLAAQQAPAPEAKLVPQENLEELPF